MYRIDPMTQEDVAEVGRLERRCFSNPWPASAYRRELQNPRQNYYVVLREESPVGGSMSGSHPEPDGAAALVGQRDERTNGNGSSRSLPRRGLLPLGLARRTEGSGLAGARAGRPPIIGFAGMWVLYDEAHVTTIGVDPAHRGRGLGELLLATMFDEAIRRGAAWLTLEVRVSNEPALALYRKYGFAVQGRRRRYYSDNNEDAHIMWSRSLHDPSYHAELAALRQALDERLGELSAISYQLSATDDARSSSGD